MPEKKTKRRPAAKKPAATRKPRAADAKSAAKRTTELSEDVLAELEDGAQISRCRRRGAAAGW